MPTNKLSKSDQKFLINLGKKVKHIILKKKGFRSLDAFSLEFGHEIAKPTLYQICDGKRDLKMSTLLSLCRALRIQPVDLISSRV